jgi:hypothetical protein
LRDVLFGRQTSHLRSTCDLYVIMFIGDMREKNKP